MMFLGQKRKNSMDAAVIKASFTVAKQFLSVGKCYIFQG